MKRTLTLLIGIMALAGLLARCDVTGGAPIDVGIVAESDTAVRVSWVPPANGAPDAYLVYFRPVNDSTFEPILQTGDTTFVHKPHGVTGTYKVLAQFGPETFDGQDRPTTVPWFADTMTVGELNSGMDPGYGWSRSGNGAMTYAMDQPGSAYDVDLYITDMAAGSAGPVYQLASPDLGPTDPGGTVPQAAWRVTGFTAALLYEHEPLPRYDVFTYQGQQALDTLPQVYGVHTEDGHYGMVKVLDIIPGNGVVFKSWLQPVAGLRLIKH